MICFRRRLTIASSGVRYKNEPIWMPPIFIAGIQHVLAIVTAAMMASTTNGRTTFATFLNINPPFLTVSYSMKCRILRNQPALLRGHGLHICELLDAGPGFEPGLQLWVPLQSNCGVLSYPMVSVVILSLGMWKLRRNGLDSQCYTCV